MKLPLELVHARLTNNADIDRHPEFRKVCAGDKEFGQFVATRCARTAGELSFGFCRVLRLRLPAIELV